MRVLRAVLYLNVVLLIPVVVGCATNGRTVNGGQSDLKVTLVREGRFIPADPVELKYWPQAYDGALRIESVVEDGTFVKKGDVVLCFEKEKAEELLDAKELELQTAALRLQDARAQLDLLDADMEVALVTAENAAQYAKKDYDTYVKTEILLDDDQHAHQRRGTEDSIQRQKEELEQLGKMYSEDELTEETEEIVLNRAKRRLEHTIAGLELSDRYRSHVTESARPKKLEEMALAVRSKNHALEKVRASQKNQKALKQAELHTQETTLQKQTLELRRLRKDVENLVIRAPVDGMLFHGEADAQERTLLNVKDSCKPYMVLLTIVEPGRLKAQCMIEEKDRFRVRPGMPVTAKPIALGTTKLSGSIESVDLLPAKNGQWKALAGLDEADPRLVPGMKCNVEILIQSSGEEQQAKEP